MAPLDERICLLNVDPYENIRDIDNIDNITVWSL